MKTPDGKKCTLYESILIKFDGSQLYFHQTCPAVAKVAACNDEEEERAR